MPDTRPTRRPDDSRSGHARQAVRDSSSDMAPLKIMLTAAAVLLLVLSVLLIVFLATKPSQKGDTPSADTTETLPDRPVVSDGVTLPPTEDAGKAYQDSLIFVGDSLTAHLVSRGVLSGGKSTKQVWKTETNMLNLNSEVTRQQIVYPETGEKMTIAEAAALKKPSVLIITLGTDWGVAYLNETDFKACYGDLVRDIQKASPKTRIILQSVFPVTESCTILKNTKIDQANLWVKAVAAETGCRYLDTQSVLKDDKGCLRKDFCNSHDGIHLTKEAYEAILLYIRTHALT